MALSGDGTWDAIVIQDVESLATKTMVVKSAAVVYNGALCTHDTSSGEIKPFDGTQTDQRVGWHFGDSVTGASGTTPRPRATICYGGFIARNLTCAGLANDATDYGKGVYATDDTTYTITDPGSGVVIGQVLADEDRSSGKANIQFDNIFGKVS